MRREYSGRRGIHKWAWVALGLGLALGLARGGAGEGRAAGRGWGGTMAVKIERREER